MRAVIISGGSVTDYGYIRRQIKADDILICADSGYDHAVKMGLQPKAVVGDFDSISRVPADIETVRYPARKDHTDTEIALEYARGLGIGDFLLIAATGSRLDHTLANILLLKDCSKRGEKAVMMDEHNKMIIAGPETSLCEPAGSTVSLIPLSECSGVTTHNLEYPLREASLPMGTGLGISNIMTENNALVSVREGLLLIIVAKD